MQCQSPLKTAQVSAPTLSLSELQSVHENVIAWISALDDLTQQPTLRRGQLEAVRWFLSKARRERRVLLEQIYAAMIPRLPQAEANAVRSVRAITHQSLRAASEHIAKWPMDAVEKNWAGYCEQTRNVSDLWLRAIDEEREVLYPVLRRFGCSASSEDATRWAAKGGHLLSKAGLEIARELSLAEVDDALRHISRRRAE